MRVFIIEICNKKERFGSFKMSHINYEMHNGTWNMCGRFKSYKKTRNKIPRGCGFDSRKGKNELADT